MALKSQPKFEEATEATVAAPSTGVANSAPTAVAEYKGFVNVAEKFLNKLPPIPLGGLPTLKAKSGFIVDNAGVNLGNEFTLDLVSYNYKWIVTPGEEGDEAAKLLRTSYNEETLENSGQSCADYLAFLKAEGYNNAKITKRIDAVGILESAATATYPRLNDMVLVDIAPTSVGAFEGQLIQAGVKFSRGLMTEAQLGKLRFRTVAKTSKGKTWSALDVVGA